MTVLADKARPRGRFPQVRRAGEVYAEYRTCASR